MRTSRYRAEPRPTHALNNALFLLHFHAGLQLCGRSSADLLACSNFREHRHQRPRPSSSYPNRLAFTFVAYPVSVIAINGRSRVRGPETYDAALAAICQSLAHRFDGEREPSSRPMPTIRTGPSVAEEADLASLSRARRQPGEYSPGGLEAHWRCIRDCAWLVNLCIHDLIASYPTRHADGCRPSPGPCGRAGLSRPLAATAA